MKFLFVRRKFNIIGFRLRRENGNTRRVVRGAAKRRASYVAHGTNLNPYKRITPCNVKKM